jgi:hypothetical protein
MNAHSALENLTYHPTPVIKQPLIFTGGGGRILNTISAKLELS